MMPIVGRLYTRVSPRLTVAIGVLLFTISAYLMSHYTLDTTTSDVVVVLAIQGVAFSCLFIPLTTVALASIPRHRLADATGLNSLMRQIGGSLGLAIFASLIPRFTKHASMSIGAHLTPGRLAVSERLAGMERFLEGRGIAPSGADSGAARLLAGIVTRQATVLTFERLFLLSGILFLLVLPLLFFLKAPTGGSSAPVDAHVEV
jgi:DHA2 family multidrug resistance protein